MVRVHGVAPPEGPAEKGTARIPTLAPARAPGRPWDSPPPAAQGPLTSSDPRGHQGEEVVCPFHRRARGALDHRTAASGCGTHPDDSPSARLSASSHRTSLSVKRHSSVRARTTDPWWVSGLPGGGTGGVVGMLPGPGGPGDPGRDTGVGAREAKRSSRSSTLGGGGVGERPEAFPAAVGSRGPGSD